MIFRRRRVDEPAPKQEEDPGEAAPDRDPQLSAIASLSSALARARDQDAVARTLLEACLSLLEVDFGAVALISEDRRRARGLQALAPGADTSWWQEVSIDFEQEPSGIESAIFEGGPIVVYDVAGSQRINRRLAEKVGAKSAVFVPLVSEESVPAVLILVTTKAPKVFEGDELSLLQALAAEAALALDRTRSADALAEALERERLIASIARKVRSELDLDAVLRVAVEETGVAVGVDRFSCASVNGPARCRSRRSGMRTGSSRSMRLPTGFRSPTSRRASAGRWPSATSARIRRSTTRSWAGSRPCSSSTRSPPWRRRSSSSTR